MQKHHDRRYDRKKVVELGFTREFVEAGCAEILFKTGLTPMRGEYDWVSDSYRGFFHHESFYPLPEGCVPEFKHVVVKKLRNATWFSIPGTKFYKVVVGS